VLQLVADRVLREPLVYPSLFFKTHRSLYYHLLNEVRLRGDWERWLDFFAEGVQVSAAQGLATAHSLLALVNADRERIATLGRASVSALAVHRPLQAPADRHVGGTGQGHGADAGYSQQVARPPRPRQKARCTPTRAPQVYCISRTSPRLRTGNATSSATRTRSDTRNGTTPRYVSAIGTSGARLLMT